MRVAIITPYFNETPEMLYRCQLSVDAQTHKCDHILIADGPDAPTERLLNLNPDFHIQLPKANADYGDTPRFIGTVYAYSQGYDAVCWLDADNWLEPNHVESCIALANADPYLEIVTARRNLWRPDITFLGEDIESDGETFNDTNCYFVLRSAMSVACTWGFKDKRNAVIGDRFVWSLSKTKRRVHNNLPTVNYVSKVAQHYIDRNEEPPVDSRMIIKRPGSTFFESVPFAAIKDQITR